MTVITDRLRLLSSGGNYASFTSSATSDYTLVYPNTTGASGQVLSTDGTGILSWVNVGGSGTVTSVGLAAPSAFTVTGSPITAAGTLTLSYSGLAIPLTSGGTGLTTIGGNGTVLTSNGSSASWTAPATSGTVTSVAATVPSVFSISGSPITSSGTLAISYSGTALPIANGGTGSTSATGTGLAVLQTSPSLVTPALGAATGTSLNLSGLTASTAVATDGSKNLVSVTNTGTGNNVLQTSPLFVTGFQLNNTAQTQGVTMLGSGLTSSYNWVYPATAGTSGQFLTSGAGSTLSWTTPTVPTARPMVTYYPGGTPPAQTLANNSNTILTVDTKATALSSGTIGLSFASNTFTCTTAGQYTFSYNITLGSNSGASPVRVTSYIGYKVNNAGTEYPLASQQQWYPASGSENMIVGGSETINMAVNDVAYVMIYQNTGANQSITNNTTNFGVYFKAVQLYP